MCECVCVCVCVCVYSSNQFNQIVARFLRCVKSAPWTHFRPVVMKEFLCWRAFASFRIVFGFILELWGCGATLCLSVSLSLTLTHSLSLLLSLSSNSQLIRIFQRPFSSGGERGRGGGSVREAGVGRGRRKGGRGLGWGIQSKYWLRNVLFRFFLFTGVRSSFQLIHLYVFG